LPLKLLQSAASGGEQQLYLWGPEKAGKSHLLQATCRAAGAMERVASYLPLGSFPVGDLRAQAEILDGLESLELVCLDDLHCIAGDRQWEEAIFDLINRIRQVGSTLVCAAREIPGQLGLGLEDLVSRLCWGPVVRLNELDDSRKAEALQQRARSRGLTLSAEACSYILSRYPRDLASLLKSLERLDYASMVAQRRLTIPFIKQVLG
jgi:DnaA family protein